VYIRHLSPFAEWGDLPQESRLDDPDPDDRDRPAVTKWWPPVMLEPSWVTEKPDFDLFHLQSGFDAWRPEELAELIDTLRAEGKPFFYAVHDLRNPHHIDRGDHDAQLDVLIPATDALITLTPGAAAEIEARWGHRPVVLPHHPYVVEIETMRRLRRRTRPLPQQLRVGLHVKSLRACMDPLAVLPGLTRAVQAIPGGVLQVNGHADVLDPSEHRYDAELAAALRNASPRVDVHIHDFLSGADLWSYLAGLDVSVLPYRFGIHSGWLEACRDLGTAVVAPTCGYHAQQASISTFAMDERTYDVDSLVDAVIGLSKQPPTEPVPVQTRLARRQRVAAAHFEIYARLLGM
jgi:hypothetical protein